MDIVDLLQRVYALCLAIGSSDYEQDPEIVEVAKEIEEDCATEIQRRTNGEQN